MAFESVPEIQPLRMPLDQAQLDALSRFTLSTRRLITGRLGVANQRAQLLGVVIQWPNNAIPRVLTRPTLANRPKSVVLSECRIGNAATEPASIAATLEWDWDAGSILLPQFVNGSLTTRWALRLLVVEE